MGLLKRRFLEKYEIYRWLDFPGDPEEFRSMLLQLKKSAGKMRFIGWNGLVLRPHESPYATRAYYEVRRGPVNVVVTGDEAVITQAHRSWRNRLSFIAMWVYFILSIGCGYGFFSGWFYDLSGESAHWGSYILFLILLVFTLLLFCGRLARVNRHAELAAAFRYLIGTYGQESWGDVTEASEPWKLFFKAQRLIIRGFGKPNELDQVLAQIREAPVGTDVSGA